MEGRDTYLLPEQVCDISLELFPDAVQADINPIEIDGFSEYTFLRRLDNVGFSMTCVLIEKPGRKSYVYPFFFNGEVPDFWKYGLIVTDSPKGKVIHMSLPTFDLIDSKDIAIPISNGNWYQVKNRMNIIAALSTIGIIENISPVSFDENLDLSQYESRFNRIYGTFGDFQVSLTKAYNRVIFAMKFFCISTMDHDLEAILMDRQYSFSALYPLINDSPIIGILRQEMPSCSNITSPFLVLNYCLKSVFEILSSQRFKVDSVDDFDGFSESIKQFQQASGIHPGACDIKTLRLLIKSAKMQHFDQLPIFKMAGIKIQIANEPEYPTIPKLSKIESDPLAEQVRLELNKALSDIPDPSAKIQWMKGKIDQLSEKYNDECEKMCSQVVTAENRIVAMSNMLREIVEESNVAVQKVEAASKLLNEVHQAHNKIQDKFESLRDGLFNEQRNTRVILVIGVLFTILGALRILWK